MCRPVPQGYARCLFLGVRSGNEEVEQSVLGFGYAQTLVAGEGSQQVVFADSEVCGLCGVLCCQIDADNGGH